MSRIEKKYQAFVSSTYEDLRDERNTVVLTLLERDCIPTGMELFVAANKSSWEIIETAIKESDIYVVIIGNRYGSTCEDGRSFTEREYDLAQESRKTILAFLPKKLSYDESESNDMRARLDKFIDKIKAKKQASFYSNKDELRAVVTSAVSKAISTDMIESAGWVRLVDTDKSMNVRLPNKFILFISGATGVGKSTVARRLIHKIPRFIVLEESDLIREGIRATLNECIDRFTNYLNRKNVKGGQKYNRLEIEKLLDWQIVNSSSKDLNSRNIKKQYQWLVPAMKQKCSRLNRLRVPTIIEGIGVSFEEMFNDDYFKSLGNSNNALFVNLVLSDMDEHKRRLRERSEERGESETFAGNKKYDPIKVMGRTLRDQTELLSTRYNNVINIDASGSKDVTVHRIIEAIVTSVEPYR